MPMMTGMNNDEESKLLTNLEGAMESARNLELYDLQLILKMATLELWNQRAKRPRTLRLAEGGKRR